MRGCVTSIILLVLLAASGYCLWQIHLLRADVTAIRDHVLQEQAAESQSLADHARAALDAVKRGESERAQAELDRLAELVEESKSIVGEKRDEVRRRLGDAREAVAKGSADARDRVNELLRVLLGPWRLADSDSESESPAEQ
jgi:multidrug resistance efflux pump